MTATKMRHISFAAICLALFFVALLGIRGYQIYKNRDDDKAAREFAAHFEKISAEKPPQETARQPAIIPLGAVKVPILVYHSVRPHREKESRLVAYYDVAPQALEKQLRYFRDNGYRVISFGALVNALLKKEVPPPKSIVLTFDDGWESQYKYAFPLLKKYGVTAAFFVFTNALGHKHFLSWEEVRELDAAGMTIGAHTKSHPYLLQITDPNQLRDEIIGGKKVLEGGLGKPVGFFAYPFGNYSDRIVSVVKEAGFVAARSSKKGIYHAADDIFKLKSIEATDDFGKLISEIDE